MSVILRGAIGVDTDGYRSSYILFCVFLWGRSWIRIVLDTYFSILYIGSDKDIIRFFCTPT